MLEKLKFLYGEEIGKKTYEQLLKLLDSVKGMINCDDRELWSEKDIFLITYPDSFYEKGSPVLKTLAKFLKIHLKGIISGVHILPFSPYSSDRGFSITDFTRVKEEFGDWKEMEGISKNFRLMADLVLNHVSVKHEWFQRFLAGDSKYWDYFIHFNKSEIPEAELKQVVRPRATPLLTPFKTANGERRVWTTFSVEDSTDQIDLNYQNPEVLLEMIKIILLFLQKGIRIFRLDAIPFIWKEVGTDCYDLKQVHIIINLFRQILDEVCPRALLLSQSSMPWIENLAYLGGQNKEANLVYNFPLPPLILDAYYNRNTKQLNDLAEKMNPPDQKTSFFNILAVHDGIGLSGIKGFLSEQEVRELSIQIQRRGGCLSYRSLPDGDKKLQELNITWWSALNQISEESFDLKLQKFITSHALMFALKGIPAIYYLSLFGQENDRVLYGKTKIKRDLNRSDLELGKLEESLKTDSSKENRVFAGMKKLMQKKRNIPAFHPDAGQEVLDLDKRVFALLRRTKDQAVVALHNLSPDKLEISYNSKIYTLDPFSFIWDIS